jgi:hypothetical protein
VTRRPFGGGAGDFVEQIDTNGVVHGGVSISCTFWTAASGGTQVTDLRDLANNPIASVISSSSGQIPQFQGPNDGSSSLWVDVSGTARQQINSTDIASRLTTLEAGSRVTTTKTANYTAVDKDRLLVNAASAPVSITLPPTSTVLTVDIKKIDSSANLVTVLPSATNPSATIDGQASLVIGSQWGSYTVVGDGTNYFII